MAADDRAAPPLADPVPDPLPDPVPTPVDDPNPTSAVAADAVAMDAVAGDAVAGDAVAGDAVAGDVAVSAGPAPSLGEVALANRAGAIAAMDLVDRPAAFEDLDAAIVAELRAIEDL